MQNNWATYTSLKKALTVVGSIGGYIGGRYAGIHLLAPLILIASIALILKKILRPPLERYGLIMAILSGHALWIFIGGLLSGRPMAGLLDFVLYGGGMAWLLAKPGIAPLWFLSALELAIGGLNLFQLMNVSYGTLMHRALTSHVAIRLCALALMGMVIYKLKRGEGPVPTPALHAPV